MMPCVYEFLDGRVLVACAEGPVAEPLIRRLAQEMTGRDPGPLHHSCPFCGSIEHGRPYVDAPVQVSVAHARRITCVAVSVAGPVGVDVESDAALEWVRAEAVGKALGVGIVGDACDVPVWESQVAVPGHMGVVVTVLEQAALAAVARAATR